MSLFFAFGTTMSGITALMLLFPGSALEPLWRLNPHAREGFALLGQGAVILMLTVCAACTLAALGLWRYKAWGYWTAIVVLLLNLIGDTANAAIARDWHTLLGLPIAAVMIGYLVTRRRMFAPRNAVE